MTIEKKRIFYFEDEPELLHAYFKVLRAKYEATVGASEELIKQLRQQPIDLIIVDIMIHYSSFDEMGNLVRNVVYEGVNWQQTGIEFLKRVRAGDYTEFGFPDTVPAIIATARADDSIREAVGQLGVQAYLEKPFTVDELEDAVDAILIG